MDMVEVDDGARLRTWTTGTGSARPPVVLLHGGPGLWDYLEPVARLLEPLTVVHRFDQRGCGGSDAGGDPAADYTFARALADLESLRRHWGHDSWSVIGHSFGATLAFAYASAHPRAVRALAYLNGVGRGDWRGPARREAARRMSPAQRHRLAELERQPARTRDEEAEFRALCWFTDHADRARAWAWAVEDAHPDRPINWRANRALMSASDLPPADLAMPCWFIHGEHDPRPVHTVAALAVTVRDARLHVIGGAGHHPWRERPAELGTLLRAFVTEAAAIP